MIESIIEFFKQSAEKTKNSTPEGLCPNCISSLLFILIIQNYHSSKYHGHKRPELFYYPLGYHLCDIEIVPQCPFNIF